MQGAEQAGSSNPQQEDQRSELEEKLLRVLAGEKHADAEAAVEALMRKLRDKARKPAGGNLEDLTKLHTALAYQLEEARRVELEAQERAEQQRLATLEMLSPCIGSLGCAVLIGVSQAALQEKMVALEETLKCYAEGARVELGATVEEEIDRLRMRSTTVPQTCSTVEDTELLFQELQRINGDPRQPHLRQNRPAFSPSSPVADHEALSKDELVARVQVLESKLKSVVGLVNQFQVSAQLESALRKANKQHPDI